MHIRYQNSGLFDAVMQIGLYNGDMIRLSDEEDTLRVSDRRRVKKKKTATTRPQDVSSPKTLEKSRKLVLLRLSCSITTLLQ